VSNSVNVMPLADEGKKGASVKKKVRGKERQSVGYHIDAKKQIKERLYMPD